MATGHRPCPLPPLTGLGGRTLMTIARLTVVLELLFLKLIALSRSLYRKNRWGKIGG